MTTTDDELDALRRTVHHYEALEAVRHASVHSSAPDVVVDLIEAYGPLPTDHHGRLDVVAFDKLVVDTVRRIPALGR